jgi:hypothetical protein
MKLDRNTGATLLIKEDDGLIHVGIKQDGQDVVHSLVGVISQWVTSNERLERLLAFSQSVLIDLARDQGLEPDGGIKPVHNGVIGGNA